MPILATDIKLLASQVMDDVPEGGGAPVSTVIVDGASNAIFADISELDRAGGDVSLRKVFVSVQTPDRDTYLGANVIIADQPADPKVAVSMFSTAETFDRRTDARDRIESYLAPGPEWNGYLFENHIAGQSAIRLFQRPGTETPPIGRTLVLVWHEGLSDERMQYVRVTDVSAEEREFTYMNGSNPEEFTAQVVTLDLSDALRYDFPGSPPARTFTPLSTATKTRDTVVANAARYYGVAKLTDPIAISDVSAAVDTIFTQLVPSAQTEIPMIDQSAGGQMDTPIDSASGTVSYTTNQPIASETALSVGNPITPGTLVITTSGGELTDFGGQLYAGAEAIGTVDYPRGTVTLMAGAPTYSGSKTITFRPSAAPLILADTAITLITVENRAFNYVRTFTPAPQPGTLVVSYRSNGRWYDLRDNGAGQLRGSDSSFGVGTVSYSTGTVAVTLGALPDAGTALLYAWGAAPNYINRSNFSVLAPRVHGTLAHTGVAPGTVTITWNDGVARTATDDGKGAITGDATGSIRYQTGDFAFTPNALPLGGQVFAVDYGYGAPTEDTFSNPPREPDQTITLDLSLTNLAPGTVELEWELNAPAVEYAGVNYPFEAKRIARDDGLGALKIGSTTVGSINYSTGIVSAFQPDMTASVPTLNYDYQQRITSSLTTYFMAFMPTGVSYVNKAVTLKTSVPIKVRFRALGSDTTVIDELVGPVAQLKFDLTDRFAELIVPGSVNFQLGGRTYFDRQGSLYYGLEVTTGAATLGGSINYQTGEVTLSSWAGGQSNAVTLKSLLTTLDGRPVSVATFRVPVAPLRPSSFQVLATKVAGGTINVTADGDGNLTGSGISGTIDYETGVAVLQFGTLVAAAGNESQPWYDPDLVSGGNIWRPEPVFADTIRFNAVAFTYLPLDADILGLDPVRLPQDGRVPIFRVGGFVVIGHTDTTAPATVSNGGTINCGRTRLSRVRVLGNDNAVIASGFSVDLEAGIVTFTNVSGYSQPVRVEHRIEDMLQVSDVQISGDMSFTRQVSHAYPTGSFVSSALVVGDLRSRVSTIFDQQTWNGTTWTDTVSGTPATGTYNDIAAPIEVTNDGALTERWAMRFTSSTGFDIIGEHVGVIGTGNINTITAPLNPATGQPYFTIPTAGWGIGWVAGNILRFNTVGAVVPVWLVRTVQQGEESSNEHKFTLLARGDVDAP